MVQDFWAEEIEKYSMLSTTNSKKQTHQMPQNERFQLVPRNFATRAPSPANASEIIKQDTMITSAALCTQHEPCPEPRQFWLLLLVSKNLHRRLDLGD
jgi:hypothetical protein